MKHVKVVAILALGLGILSLPVALQSRVKDTPHKLTGTNGIAVDGDEVCLPCHTPHNALLAGEALWNHSLSSATYTLWEGIAQADVTSSSSKLCLGCHDGTVALDSYGGATGTHFISGRENLGTDLTKSHPIGVVYPTTATRYNQPDPTTGRITDVFSSTTPTGQYASLEDGKVQCSSCHRAHSSNDSRGNFLRIDNHNSQLCMACHISPG